ncbi:11778_t:CDS:2 [Racocetra persica]|uniref:11778_t:CDS:1 n=1 Tax=Racocetra persica TaxID=160502 RepID=A0ACA9KV13_9GLOM|nr:11778_t:CDS:2 [Racocetra persica]
MESEDNSRPAEEQLVNISQSDQNLAEAIDAPVVGQIFRDWEELDLFISLYAKTQNFVSVIHGSEYDKGVCRIHRYAFNGLLKKAIQTGLDAGAIAIKELEEFMNDFINNKIQQKEDDETTSNCSFSNKENFIEIEDPVVHARRDDKKKPSIKKHSNAQKSRKPTQCQQCQNTGHNKAGCEAWHKRQGVPYLY